MLIETTNHQINPRQSNFEFPHENDNFEFEKTNQQLKSNVISSSQPIIGPCKYKNQIAQKLQQQQFEQQQKIEPDEIDQQQLAWEYRSTWFQNIRFLTDQQPNITQIESPETKNWPFLILSEWNNNNHNQLRNKKLNLIDIDECQDDRACGRGAICENLPGSFHCSCPPGFTGDPSVECIGKFKITLIHNYYIYSFINRNRNYSRMDKFLSCSCC